MGSMQQPVQENLEVVNTLIPSIICIDNISIDLEEGDACSKTVEFEFPEVVNSCGNRNSLFSQLDCLLVQSFR